MFSDIGTATVLFGIAAFLVSGTVKGVLGIGLPLILVPLLATVFDLATAVTLMVVPVLASNGLQAWQGRRYALVAVRRFWLVIVTLIPFTVMSAQFLAGIDIDTGVLVLGLIVIVFVTVQIFPLRLQIEPAAERWLNAPVGALAGLLGGVSNLFGPVLIMYLVALKLPKDDFVGSIAMFFSLWAFTLYFSLFVNGLIQIETIVASAIGAVPVMAGVWAGRAVRDRVPQKTFERLLLLVLLLIGLNLVRRAVL